MQIVQACGPFKAGKEISFNYPDPKYQFRYVHIGIQTPQVPPITEVSIDKMISFSIGTGVANNPEFIINANDILEFDDFYRVNQFQIKPLKDVDRYTIVEIAFSDEVENL